MSEERRVDPTSVPLIDDLPPGALARLESFGAPPRAATLALYHAMAHQPEILEGWIEFAWRLRLESTTPRRLRELMITRNAMLAGCEYEMLGHTRMALENGATRAEIDALADWRGSDLFSESDRAALALAEASSKGNVPDDVLAELDRHFDPAERVELIVTSTFYCMVSRLIDALRLPLEPDHHETDPPKGYVSPQ